MRSTLRRPIMRLPKDVLVRLTPIRKVLIRPVSHGENVRFQPTVTEARSVEIKEDAEKGHTQQLER